MKLVLRLSILLCSFSVASKAQTSACDSIVWNNSRKLTWDDYRAMPATASRAAASTNYNFLHKWSVEKGVLTAKVVCIFSPCKSWSKSKGVALLAHEQGHFDIAEYYRRVYNKRILEEKYTPQTLRLITLKTYVDIQLECARLQDRYDEETNHRLIEVKQAEWLGKIDSLLGSMKEFGTEEVKVRLQ